MTDPHPTDTLQPAHAELKALVETLETDQVQLRALLEKAEEKWRESRALVREMAEALKQYIHCGNACAKCNKARAALAKIPKDCK